MRVTVDIEESVLEKIISETQEKKKSPAIARALDEFLENRRRQQIIDKVLAGETDYTATNDELEAMSSFE